MASKGDLIELVIKKVEKEKLELPKSTVEKVVNAVFDSLREAIKKDKVVQLVGFGSFTVKRRKERKGRNPKTGETITIKAKNTVTFRASKELKNLVN
ncbi:MAG: HU family DNA-binding protein [Planctomycetota bacterium]